MGVYMGRGIQSPKDRWHAPIGENISSGEVNVPLIYYPVVPEIVGMFHPDACTTGASFLVCALDGLFGK